MKNFKKILTLVMTLVMAVAFSSCGNKKESETSSKKEGGSYKVILLIPGNLGDKSFFDAANKGMEEVAQLEGVTTKVVEMSPDEKKWEPAFLDAIDEGYDLIISGNAASDIMNKLAEENPDSRFLNFDNSGTEAPSNVYSVTYATNEGSFLAGAFAAMVTSNKEMKNTNDEKFIGFLGGMDIPGINDFLVGYIQGAQYIDKDIKVATSYAGTFTDPAKGKELGIGMYNMGVDIAFNVAGQTGLGLIDAAYESNKYAIGVDSDQSKLYGETEPEKAKLVLTSVVKQIDTTILEGVKKAREGKLEFGKHELLGLSANAVALADNDIYQTVPAEIREKMSALAKDIIDGKIKVKSGFEMSTDEISKYRDSVSNN